MNSSEIHHPQTADSAVKQAHTVPRSYLDAFTDKNGMLYVANTFGGRPFRSKPEKAARRNYYYAWRKGEEFDEQVENFMAEEYEAYLPHVIAAAIGMVQHSPDDLPKIHLALARLAALQLLRTPRIRQQLRQRAEMEAQSPGVTLTADELALASHLNMILGETLRGIESRLQSLVPIILISPSGHPFHTSDHPVVTALQTGNAGKVSVTASMGIGKEELELHYPLTPRLSYMLIPRGAPRIMLLRPTDVDKVNTLTWVNAERHVYANVPLLEPDGVAAALHHRNASSEITK